MKHMRSKQKKQQTQFKINENQRKTRREWLHIIEHNLKTIATFSKNRMVFTRITEKQIGKQYEVPQSTICYLCT